jgi:hypothetical protein
VNAPAPIEIAPSVFPADVSVTNPDDATKPKALVFVQVMPLTAVKEP